MSYQYDVSIIVVNYNGKKYLKNLFDALLNLDCDNISFEVVFVDNASSDSSIYYIKEQKYEDRMNLNIIVNEENQGFAQGNNIGVNAAQGEYVFFLNNDTAVDRDWLKNAYYKIKQNDHYGVVASKLLFFYDFLELVVETNDHVRISKQIKLNSNPYTIENKYCKNIVYSEDIICFGNTRISIPVYASADLKIELDCIKIDKLSDRIFINAKAFTVEKNKAIISLEKREVESGKYTLIQNAGSALNDNYDGYDIGMGDVDSEKYCIERELDSACGAALLTKKDTFLSVGGFDERFFMYYEDTDLSYKIIEKGLKIIFCPTSIVRHIHTGSSGEWSPFFSYHVYRNKLLFLHKHINKNIYLKYVVKQLLTAIRHRNSMLWRGTIDAVLMDWFGLNKKYTAKLKK